MRLHSYILMISLLTILGLCTVHEAMRQTRARYKIGKLLTQEEHLQQDFVRLKSDVAKLKAARRLEETGRRIEPDMIPMEPIQTLEIKETAQAPTLY